MNDSSLNSQVNRSIRTSQTDPLRIDALQAAAGMGQIGMTFCPGKHGRSQSGFDWQRDLQSDLATIAGWGATAVVTLIEDHEFRTLKVERLGETVARLGMQWYHLPIKDGFTPDDRFESAWQSCLPSLLAHLLGGRDLLVHCMGGCGRAGTVGARLLIELGEKPEVAIKRVREVRSCAIENRAQEQYVLNLVRSANQLPKAVQPSSYVKPTASWFKELTGQHEDTGPGGYERTQSRFTVEGTQLRSLEKNQTFGIGQLELLSVQELRHRAARGERVEGARQVRAVKGDAGFLHVLPENQRALFQVASQFNLLEMPGNTTTPERGVTNYVTDNTQGPACAIAAGAATIYRNYFAPVDGQRGQTKDRQIDGFFLLGSEIARRAGHSPRDLWSMRNGYAMFEPGAVDLMSELLTNLSEREADSLRQLLRIGVQWDVQVTSSAAPAEHYVTQAFCSALPIGYHYGIDRASANWEPLARLVLDALYEATLWAAVLNAQNGGSRTVFLTFVGGGVFENSMTWIRSAIERAVAVTSGHGLDIAIVYLNGPTSDDLTWVDGLSKPAPAPAITEPRKSLKEVEGVDPGDDVSEEDEPSAAELRSQLRDLSRYPSDWRKVLGQLVQSAKYCEQAGSAAWSVTLRGASYRLNVGTVEVMTTTLSTMDAKVFNLPSDRSFADVRLLISGPEAADLAARFKDHCVVVAERYKSVGEPHWSIRVTWQLEVSPDDPDQVFVLEALRAMQGAHKHFVQKATRTPTGKIRQRSNYYRTHSPSLYECAVNFLDSAVRIERYKDLLWNDDLLPEHIPALDAGWNEISAFALTLLGDGQSTARSQDEFERELQADELPLSELRLWLYGTQRAWRWGSMDGEPPWPELMQVIRAVVEAIRRRVEGVKLKSEPTTVSG